MVYLGNTLSGPLQHDPRIVGGVVGVAVGEGSTE